MLHALYINVGGDYIPKIYRGQKIKLNTGKKCKGLVLYFKRVTIIRKCDLHFITQIDYRFKFIVPVRVKRI